MWLGGLSASRVDRQVSNRLYVYNNRLSGSRTIGGLEFCFIKVADNRLGGVSSEMTSDGVRVQMPLLARALMDAVYDWSRFDTLPAAYEWIRNAVRKKPALMVELAGMACRFGNQGTIRRVGYVLAVWDCPKRPRRG